MKILKEGDEVCTISRFGSKTATVRRIIFPIYCGSIYKVHKTKDERLIFKKVGYFGETRSCKNGPTKKYIEYVKSIAPCDYYPGIRQNQEVQPYTLALTKLFIND